MTATVRLDRPTAPAAAGPRVTAAGVAGTVLSRYWPVLLILAAWPIWLAANGYTRTVAPGPWDVLLDLVGHPLVYLGPLLWTLLFAAVGLAGGMAVGILLGIAVSTSPLAFGLVMPSALVIRVVPMTALMPIVARVLGYSDTTILLIVMMLVFFPAFSLTASGMASAPASGTDLFRVLGAGGGQSLLRLKLPYAVPSIMLALRISAPNAVLSVLLSEYLLAGRGLGDLMRDASSFLLIEREWGVAILATAVAVACFGAAKAAERRVVERMT